MLMAQVTLTDQQTSALRSIVLRTGKTEEEIIREAVEQFIAQHTQIDRQAALRQAKSRWQDRTDLPDLKTLREESDRYSVSDAEQQRMMTETAPAPCTALRYDVEVMDEGRVELRVPFPLGTPVVVYVVEEPQDDFSDLLATASASLDFWDNALDDEDWNNA